MQVFQVREVFVACRHETLYESTAVQHQRHSWDHMCWSSEWSLLRQVACVAHLAGVIDRLVAHPFENLRTCW